MEAVLPLRRRSHGSIRSPTVKRDSLSVVVIKGWLHKLEGVGIKQWKQRWCVLSDFCLFFYKSPNEEKLFSTVLLPSYKINPCDTEDRISRKFAFKAEHQNMKTYYFAAENKDSMKRWMNAMSLASIMQNFAAKSEVVESGLGSTSNDEEDSGFTSYRSRRFGDQDPNSTFDSSHGSERLKQRSHSCGERVGEIFLSSDDKYPTSSKRGQHHSYKAHSAQRSGRPRQPLYANAPPKPKRMTHSDPFAISPGEQYGDMGYNVGQNYLEYEDTPEAYGYPDVIHPTHGIENRDPSMIDRIETNYLGSEMFQDERVPYSNLYPRNLDGSHGQPASSFEQIPRPHSADFLEREVESFIPVKNQTQETQRQRPKSSMEYYGRYWDTNDYTAEDYREAVRMQADNIFTNRKQLAHERHHHHPQHTDIPKYNSDILLPYQDVQMPMQIQQPVLHSNEHSKYIPDRSTHNKTREKRQYPSNNQSLSTHPKVQQNHEESMKRLLEWKQRMLQSPLTKRSVQYSSSSSETGSPRKPPNRPPLPNEYRDQVIHELERHEAYIRQPFYQTEPKHNIGNYNSSSTSSLKDHLHYSHENTARPSSGRRTSSDERSRDHNNSINDLNHSSKYAITHDHSESNHSSRQQGSTESNDIMYCVDSENNEILIYGDNFVTDVASSDTNAGKAQKCRKEQRKQSNKNSHWSGTSELETNLARCSSGSGSVFYPPVQASTLRRAATQKLNVGYSSDDEASVDADHKDRHVSARNRSLISRNKNASNSEIHVQKPCHLQKLVHMSETLMNKGKRLSVSAGDLLGKTHEELVLLLIQLRRNQSRVVRAKERCLLQLENMKYGSQIDDADKASYVSNCNEIIQLLDKQFESTRPLVNLVDNMVKLGSLYGSDNKKISSTLHLSAPDLNKAQDKNFMPDLHAWSSMEDNDLQEHLTELYGLDQETHSYSSLQQDREMLETTLHGMRNKILDHQDKPFELQKLRKQQRLIEKELTRVKRLLCQSAKKIEDATNKNDQLEQEILLLRQKLQQALKSGSNEMKSSQSRADLEAELTRVQNVLEELANHRQEINNTVETSKSEVLARVCCSSKVRASPTGVVGSAPLPLRKKQQNTYLETDLDTMNTVDLSNVCKEADDIPLYANAEEINQETLVCDVSAFQESGLLPPSSAGSDKENLSQCSLQDINDADDKMKRFYGILPREKPCEIKTVRIVKRQSERRNRERDKKRVTYGDQSSVWVVEEPDMSSDDQLETDDEVFKKSSSRPSSILLPGFVPQKTTGLQSAHERLFGNNATSRPPDASAKGAKSGRRLKRRHYTVSGCQSLDDPLFQFSKDKPRSRDDVDMERCLRTANTPDIVRSTIKKKDVFDDDIIDRELGLPQKISIPERYIEDEPENLSASERLQRSLKAENIRKMLSETTASYENVAKSADAPTDTVHKKFTEQKRNRAHLLALNHALAQEVMERSKAVAATNVYSSDTQQP